MLVCPMPHPFMWPEFFSCPKTHAGLLFGRQRACHFHFAALAYGVTCLLLLLSQGFCQTMISLS